MKIKKYITKQRMKRKRKNERTKTENEKNWKKKG